MSEFEVTLHGAAHTVTGSCYEVRFGGTRVLVDCGMFQGSRTLEALNQADFAFDVAAIDAVILTHAHIDHSGLIPKLVAQGYKGPIWCTVETADLLAFMLLDSARIQEHDVARRNRRPDRADEPPIEPIYGVPDAERSLKLLRTVALAERFEPAAELWAQMWNAGHVLGSASIELGVTRDETKQIVYDLVGKQLFSGYVDWKEQILYSVDSSKLKTGKCPNCSGELEIVGKGLVKCPYCGSEVFSS